MHQVQACTIGASTGAPGTTALRMDASAGKPGSYRADTKRGRRWYSEAIQVRLAGRRCSQSGSRLCGARRVPSRVPLNPGDLVMSDDRARKVLHKIDRALAAAASFGELRDLRDQAEAVHSAARAAKLGFEVLNRAAALKLKAERQAGKLLAGLRLRGGDRRTSKGRRRATLEDLGISAGESKRWQLLASVPDDAFEQCVADSSDLRQQITAAAIHRLARQLRIQQAQLAENVPRGRPGSDRGSVPSPTAPDSPELLLQEMQSHLDTLERIVESPLQRQRAKSDQAANARLVHYLIGELRRLVGDLEAVLLDARRCSQ